MTIEIDTLTEAELIDLNNRIVARLRLLTQMRAHARMLEFRIGDRVVFHPEGHLPVVGILIRYNKKTVTVIADSGQHWNVSPGLLRKESPEKASPGDSNVVPLRKNRRRSLARARTLPGRMP